MKDGQRPGSISGRMRMAFAVSGQRVDEQYRDTVRHENEPLKCRQVEVQIAFWHSLAINREDPALSLSYCTLYIIG
jgi:hypothetical protein